MYQYILGNEVAGRRNGQFMTPPDGSKAIARQRLQELGHHGGLLPGAWQEWSGDYPICYGGDASWIDEHLKI